MAQLDISQEKAAPLVYLIVFGSTLIMNTTILVPVPIATVIMMDAALLWNPILIALVTSIGGALGEMSGYYAGRLGKKIIVPESLIGCGRVAGWVNRYGPLTIFLFAFIPFLPFDIAGMVAGGSKMPLWKFLLPCWAGKFPKYILLCYAFKIGALHLLPGWFQ
jgi:membrane protein YqaA with SNARE-associated domain